MTTALEVFSELARQLTSQNDDTKASSAMLDRCADDVVFEFPFAPPGRPARV
jgi:uncharacterized protein